MTAVQYRADLLCRGFKPEAAEKITRRAFAVIPPAGIGRIAYYFRLRRMGLTPKQAGRLALSLGLYAP